MKKKIVFVTKALWIGGIETALVNLLKEFDYDKYDVTLLVLKAELDMLGQISPKCRVMIVDREKTVTFQKRYRYSRLFHLTEESENPSRLHRMMMWTIPMIRWTENRLYIRYVRKLMQKEQFETAVIYSDVAGETAIRAINADKYLMFYHHGAMRHVYHDKLAYKKCEKIIAVSENQAETLRQFIPRYKNKVIAIHNLTDVQGIRDKGMEEITGVYDKTKFHIVSVGRVSHEKGMDIAVQVCSRLVEDGYKNVRWWIVGDGPEMEKVREIIAELHMEKYVFTVGMKANPYPYIQQADLYVQPSRFEGYPMTILEALILGQVVISTDNPGASEIIDNNLTGILCPLDIKKLAVTIEMMIQKPQELKKIKKSVQQINFLMQNYENINTLEKLL